MSYNRKGGDEDSYNIRKKNYDFEEDDRNNYRERQFPRRNQRNGGQKRNDNRGKNPPKPDPLSTESLFAFVRKGGNKGGDIARFVPNKTIKMQKKVIVPSYQRLNKDFKEEYKPIRDNLDNQMDEYRKNGPMKSSHNHEIIQEFKKTGHIKNRDNSQYNERKFSNRRRQNKRNENHQERQQFRKGQEKQNSDDSDWSIVLNGKPEESFDQHNDLKKQEKKVLDQSSFWDVKQQKNIEPSRSDKDTSQSNIRKYQEKKENQLSQMNNSKDEDQSINFESSINNNVMNSHANELSNLMREQNFLDEIDSDDNKQEEQRKRKEKLQQEKRIILQKIQKSKDFPLSKVTMSVQNVQNFFDFRVKQLQLIHLEATLKIHQSEELELNHYPQISKEQIEQYIKVKQVSHLFPKFYVPKAEDNQSHIEGDEVIVDTKIDTKCEMELCQVRVGKEELKVERDLLTIRLVVVRCSNCETKNEISVIQKVNKVIGSCHKCSSKIGGKITGFKLSDSY